MPPAERHQPKRSTYVTESRRSTGKDHPNESERLLDDAKTPIREIDAVLHLERMGRDGGHRSADRELPDEPPRSAIRELPDGCFVSYGGNPFLVADGRLFPWTPFGYGENATVPEGDKVEVLTPASIVRAFRAGYAPQIALSPAGNA
ncbi:MAG TPA: hypothetical protein VGQ51_08815 [Puia sp.]|nr:hypothetical protein [Puia sp.]